MSPREPLSLADVLTEVNELLFLIERLNTRMVGNDVEIRRAIELKLRQARGRLAELLVERTASTTEADDRPWHQFRYRKGPSVAVRLSAARPVGS